MRIPIFISLLFVGLSFPVLAQHWTQTDNETIWRGRYKNCDKGYSVSLPSGVIAHGSHAPSPNHGILFSASAPETTTEVTLETERVVGVYDSYDVAEYGNPQAYLKQILDREGPVEVLASQDTKFHGFPAAYVRFRRTEGDTKVETEEIVAYRRSKNIEPIFYVIWMRSPTQYFEQDLRLYEEIRDGFHLLPAPKGQCSND